MEGKAVYKLEIDPEFKALIRPLLDAEYNELEKNILEDGCRDAIITWNGIIIDGHNRYEICTRHQIPFYVVQKRFSCRESVVAWICSNQLGRRNLSEETKKYLIGLQYEAEKVAAELTNPTGKNQYTKPEPSTGPLGLPPTPMMLWESRHATAARIGSENHVSGPTVQKYASYARSIKILEKKVPEIVPLILSGDYKISQRNVVILATHSPEEIRQVFGEIEKQQAGYARFKRTRREIEQLSIQTGDKELAKTVKDMPTFDPDAEITGLTLTIPTWTSSIERTMRLSMMEMVSAGAKEKLLAALRDFNRKAEELVMSMGGESNDG